MSAAGHDMAGRIAAPPQIIEVKVWDRFVRAFHWSLVTLFAVAFLTGDELETVHEMAGYVIAALVGARIAWGFFGSRHARFTDFVRPPREVAVFLKDMISGGAKRHLGHNPAGGMMILALIAVIGLICLSGFLMTTDAFWGVDWVEELHELAVWSALGLIALHLGGVIFASLQHKENLVKSMFTGKKRSA
ncbi:MAG: cytochrome b/b6 domain-containing protein [Rhizobiaceae bacterium]